jgi:hypothetical protein
MWIFTTTGFFSIVKVDVGRVQIRGRSLPDIRRLCRRFGLKFDRIIRTPHADYPFRVLVTRKAWVNIATALAADVEGYDNFKRAVAVTDPDRAKVYEEVWWILKSDRRLR